MICQKGKGRERTIGLLSTTRPTVINSGFLLKTAQFPAFLIQSGNISHRFKKVEREIDSWMEASPPLMCDAS